MSRGLCRPARLAAGAALTGLAVVAGTLVAPAAQATGVPGLHLTPATGTAALNASYPFTATLDDGAGNPVVDVQLVFEVVSGPDTGTALSCPTDPCTTGTDGVQATLQNQGFAGTDTVRVYRDLDSSGIFDEGEPSDTATVTFTAGPPVAVADTLLTSVTKPVTGNVLANDSGGAGPLTVTTLTITSSNGGSVTCTAEGDCTYTPLGSYTGSDAFTYAITDGTQTAQGTVTVNVYPARNILVYGPTGSPNGLAESTPGVTVTTWDTDTWASKSTADFAAFDAIVFGDQPACGADESAWGTAILSKGVWSPAVGGPVVVIGTDPDFHGKAQLVQQAVQFAASGANTGLYVALSCAYDGSTEVEVPLLSGLGTFKTVSAGCNNDAHKVAVHPALNGLDDAYLSDWSCSTHEAFTQWPATFTPLAIARTDVFPEGVAPYTASDGSVGLPYMLASGATSLGLSLSPSSASAVTGGTHLVTATLTDTAGSPLSGKTIRFRVSSGPDTGQAGSGVTTALGKATFSFTNSGTAGTDAIVAYQDVNGNSAFDAGEPQATAGVTFASASNAAPVANDDSKTTTTATSVDIDVLGNDTDADGDTLTVTTLAPTAAHGTVSCTAEGVCTYTSEVGFTGTDTFTYAISDGHGGTDTATVTVTVNAVSDTNHAPDAVNDTASALVGTPVEIDVLGNDSDVDGDPVEVTTTTTTSTGGGSVTCLTYQCTYTSAAGFTGTDTFTYAVSDGRGGTDTATVTVTVANCPSLKDALDASALVTSEQWVACSAIDANKVSTLGAPVLTPVGGSLALMTSGDADLADPPNDGSGTGRANGNSVRGGNDVSILKLNLNVPAGKNCLTFDFAFQSDEYPEYVNSSFNDGFLAELDTSDWSIDNDASLNPISAPHNFALGPDGKLISINSAFFSSGSVVEETGTEYDGSTPKLRAQTPITAGAHALYLSVFDAGDGILDSAAFVDNVQAGTAAAGTCVAGVQSDNAPVAVADSKTTNEDTALSFLPATLTANDTDADSDPITVTGVTSTVATHGTVAFNGTTITYTPEANYNGPASFAYQISDGRGGTDVGVVNVTVVPVNDNPVAVDDTKTMRQGESLALAGSVYVANDTDVDGDTVTLTNVGSPSVGQVQLVFLSNLVTFTPPSTFSGPASFTYVVSDGHGGTDTGTVHVTVTPDQAPVATGETTSVLTDEWVLLENVLSNDTDADGDALTVDGTTNPAHGEAWCGSDGACFYQPAGGYRGPDSFSYVVGDGHGKTATATVSITVSMPVHLDLTVSGTTTTRLSYGTAAPLRATLTRVGGSGVAGQAVSLWRRDRGTTAWTSMGTFVTSSTGVISLGTFKPAVHTEFQARHVSSPSTFTTSAESSVVTAYVSQRIAMTPPRQRLTGKTVPVTGSIAPAIPGAPVYLEKLVGTTWTRVVGTTESSTGTFTLTVPAAATASDTIYRVARPATTTRLGVTAAWHLVTDAGPVSVLAVNARATSLNGEYVQLKNLSTVAVNINGWKIRSNSTGRTFTLPSYAIPANGTVLVHTGTGTNSTGHVYLRSTSYIWNDAHDTARLTRNTGVLAWTFTY